VQHHAGFVSNAADLFKRFEVTDQEAAWTLGGLFGAGLETTPTTLEYFVLAMVLNPEIAKTAQKHIDAVCANRRPTFEDRKDLPYIDAIIKEVLR